MEPEKGSSSPSRWPLVLLGTLLFALWPSRRDQSGRSLRPEDTAKDKGDGAPKQSAFSPDIPSDPPTDNSNRSEDHTTLWKKIPEYTAVLIALGLLIVNICQMRSTEKAANAAQGTLGEVQKQSTMMRQQLIGTIAASVILQEPRITNDPITNKHIVVMQFLNQGHVISPEAHIAFEIDTATFPQLRTLHQLQSGPITVPQVGASGWTKRYSLADFSQADLHFPSQRKTITVRGKFGFDDGFGDKIPDQDFCFSYIGAYNTRNEDGGSTSGGGGFLPCDEFKDRVSYISSHQLR